MSLHFIKGQIFNKDVRDQFVKRAKCYLENQPASSLQKLMQSTDITGLIELSKPLLSKPLKKMNNKSNQTRAKPQAVLWFIRRIRKEVKPNNITNCVILNIQSNNLSVSNLMTRRQQQTSGRIENTKTSSQEVSVSSRRGSTWLMLP